MLTSAVSHALNLVFSMHRSFAKPIVRVQLIAAILLVGCMRTSSRTASVARTSVSHLSPSESVEAAVNYDEPRIRVGVVGAVNREGAYLLPMDATVADAVAAALGLTRRGFWAKFGSGVIHEGSSEIECFRARTPEAIEEVKKTRLRDGGTVVIGYEEY